MENQIPNPFIPKVDPQAFLDADEEDGGFDFDFGDVDFLKDAPEYVQSLKRDADIYTIQDMLLKGEHHDPEAVEYNSKVSMAYIGIEQGLMALMSRTLWSHLATVVNGVSPLKNFDPSQLEKELDAIAGIIKYLKGESDRLTAKKEELPVMTAFFLKHVIRLLRSYQRLIYEELESRNEFT